MRPAPFSSTPGSHNPFGSRLLLMTLLAMCSGRAPASGYGPAPTPPPPHHHRDCRPGLSPSSWGCIPRSSADGSVPPETQSRPAVGRRRDTPTLTPPAPTLRASPSFAPASSLEMAAAGWHTTSPTNEGATPQSTLATGGGGFLCYQGWDPPLKGTARGL